MQLQSIEKSPKLVKQLRSVTRTRHYSIRTEETYVDGVRRFIPVRYRYDYKRGKKIKTR